METPLSRFSLVTATFNRANLLRRLYKSLLDQTLAPAEWIIVDDGSSDDTRAKVEEWSNSSPFPIRYFYQTNAGRPTSMNVGVAAATGDLVGIIDDDDWLKPNALERLDRIWMDVPERDRASLTGVSVNCQFESGEMVGEPFPSSPVDSTLLEMRIAGHLAGDKWGFHRREVIQRFPFPVFPGERYVPEAIVWNRIGREYRMRFVNETLAYKVYLPAGITRRWVANCSASARGTRLYYAELAEMTPTVTDRLRALINAARYGRHGGENRLPGHLLARFPLLAAAGHVLGWVAWRRDLLTLHAKAARPAQ